MDEFELCVVEVIAVAWEDLSLQRDHSLIANAFIE